MGDSIDQITDVLQQGIDEAKRLGATAAKILFSRSANVACSFESARLKTAYTQQGVHYGVTTLVDGRRGSTSSNDLDSLSEMVQRAVSLARAGSAAHFDAYPAPAETVEVKTHSDRTESFTRDQLIDGCQTMVDGLKEYDPELYIDAGGGRDVSEKIVVTSGGVCHHSRGSSWGHGVGAQRTEGSDMLFARSHRGWRDVNEFYDPDVPLRHVLDDLRHGERIVDAPKGKVPAFLDGATLNMFLWPITLGVNGRNVAKGDSPLKGRLGEQLLDPCLTLVDDPHRDYSPGAAEIDDDGVPTRVMTIVEKGELKSFLYDLDSAGLAGAEPTGNNGCAPHALTVSPGDTPSDDLLASIDDGIYIKSLIGFGQSNIMNGDFSSNVALGFRVQNGKITGRVKNTMVAGNVYDLFKTNVRLSSDYEDPTRRMPYALVDGMSVSAP